MQSAEESVFPSGLGNDSTTNRGSVHGSDALVEGSASLPQPEYCVVYFSHAYDISDTRDVSNRTDIMGDLGSDTVTIYSQMPDKTRRSVNNVVVLPGGCCWRLLIGHCQSRRGGGGGGASGDNGGRRSSRGGGDER